MKLFGPKYPEEVAKRVPPGQRLVKGWPVLHYGPIPSFDESEWDFDVSGLIEHPYKLSYAELKALGVDDFFVIQDAGSYQWSISLGVFRSEAAAQARIADLKAKGVRSAQVGARVSQVPKVWLRVRDTDPALRARLHEVARAINGSELRDCK